MRKLILLASASICASALLSAQVPVIEKNMTPDRQFKRNVPKSFIDKSAMDRSVRPGDDFYSYANGNWIKTNEIPATETSWGNASIVRKETRQRLESLIKETAAQKNTPGSNAQKLQDFYNSGMDTLAIEKLGFTPLAEDLKRIDKISSIEGLMKELITQYASGISTPMFSMSNLPDPVDNDKEVLFIGQGGMGLPEKSYYFDASEKSQNIRNAYVAYMQRLLQLTGVPEADANAKAKNILALETNLAKSARTATENRNIQKQLNYYTQDKLNEQFPAISWDKILKQLNIQTEKRIVGQPEFFDNLNKEITSTSLQTWKDYMKLRLLNGAASYLSSSFVQATFDFYGATLNGQKQMTPRGERVATLIDSRMGEILGRLYVEKYFSADAKKRMNELVDNIVLAFGERIKSNTWMTDSTREKALQKLSAIRRKIAYPDTWRDYSGLSIGKNFYDNVKAAAAFDFRYRMSQIGKPVNRDKWSMTPPTLNAYYNGLNNEIVFPAGILLPPWFDPNADDAVNYGGIGTVIGHEIGHGFDDNGSQFDAQGKFRNWWSKADRDNFEAKGSALAAFFSNYVALDTMHVNGKLTLGENIGDLCGVTVAYQAFKKTAQGKGNVLIDGLTPDQRFFLSYAAAWRRKQRDESLRTQVLTDPHSPANFRVNGPLSNFTPFYTAFDVKEGDKMWRPVSQRIEIW